MKKVNMNFIAQNVAPIGTKQVAIFDGNGNVVATLPLGGLAHKHQGNKLYSFGALSDVHLPYAAQNASSDFQQALTYFNNVANVDFICISGDMSDTGTDAEWLDYKNHVDMYSPNTPVHLSAGNHDATPGLTYNYPIQYTGNPLWYSFEQNNDVFIMFGLRQWQGNDVFHNEALQWLYETLEENKDKRCFVFQHEMRLDGCGNAHGLYGWDGLSGRNGQVFLSLMEHYKNVIWFHGHSHTPFRLQSVQPTPIANYDRLHGCHSVHIPSLAIPRYGNSDVIFDAEGYVVDVYENGIHLRGIDFIEKEFVPIASYWIDTTPVKILEGSYVDNIGVITKKCISLPGGSELIMNQRYSYSENGLVTDTNTPSMFTVIIPVMSGTDYVLKIKNSNIDITAASSSVIYGIDSSKMAAQKINGGNIPSMTTGITYSEDKKSADITFTTDSNVSYIALTLRALTSGTLTENDIKDYKIEIEAQSIKIPEEVLNHTNLVPTSIDVDGTIYNSVGYKNNTYITTSGNIPAYTSTEFVTTGLIEIPKNYILYVYGATLDTSDSYCRVAGYNESKECVQVLTFGGRDSINVIDMDNGIQRIEIANSTLISCRYIRFSFKGVGTNLYVYNAQRNPIVYPSGSELYLNQQYSQSGGGLKDRNGYYSIIMPIKANTKYTLSVSDIVNLNTEQTTLYTLDNNKSNATTINGSKYVYTMGGVTFTNTEMTSATVDFTSDANSSYAVFVSSIIPAAITEDRLEGIVIVLEEDTENESIEGFSTDLLETCDVKLNQRWSASSNAYVGQVGLIGFSVPYSDINGRTIKLMGFKCETGDGSAWYAYDSAGNNLGRIAATGSGVVWDSSALIDNGDGSYDIPISPGIFKSSGTTSITEIPATVYISMRVDNAEISSIGDCRMLVSDIENEPIVYPAGSELRIGQRYSQSGGGYTDDSQGIKSFTLTIPVESVTKYTLTFENFDVNINQSGSTLYMLDSNKSNPGSINGNSNFYLMTEGVTPLDDGLKVEFTTYVDTKYIVATVFLNRVVTTESDLSNYIITLEASDTRLTQGDSI